MLAPIVLFAYKRPEELKRTIKALKDNFLAEQSELFIFIDGPKSENDKIKNKAVRDIAEEVNGFKKVTIKMSEKNIGCADSIINGVTKILEAYNEVIVLEDDIVTSKNFLAYMNQNLKKYRDNLNVFSIGGYTFDLNLISDYDKDIYFIKRTCAWGWAIWKDRWGKVDWEIKDYKEFINSSTQKKGFNMYGSDRVSMLMKTMKHEIDAWDIRLCYSQFKNGGLTVYPVVSKVENIGFYSNDAVNTNVYNRYKSKVDLSEKKDFILPDEVIEMEEIRKMFVKNFSIYVRVVNKIKTILGVR